MAFSGPDYAAPQKDRVHPASMIDLVDEATQARNTNVLAEFLQETKDRTDNDRLARIPEESDRFAVFVGWQPDARLEHIFRNVMHFLGPGWGLQVIVWHELAEHIKSFSEGWRHIHFCIIRNPSPGPGVLDDMMTRPYFWSLVKGSHVLFFDADTLLLDHRVDEFIGYDYIGSPWAPGKSFSPRVRVGDGGFSLRCKSTMEAIANRFSRRNVISREDVFFPLECALQGDSTKVADVETARQFSVESLYTPSPFGLHRPWECLPTKQFERLLATVNY